MAVARRGTAGEKVRCAMHINELTIRIRDAQPRDKLRADTIAAKAFYRRAGYCAAAVLWGLFRLPPNGISFLGCALAVSSIGVAWWYPHVWLVSILVVVIGLLDCADGSLARYLKRTGPKGELADAIGGFIVLWSMPFVGWLMVISVGRWGVSESGIAGMGTACVVAFHYLGRSAYQKSVQANESTSHRLTKRRRGVVNRVDGELSFCGFMFPFCIAFWIAGLPVVSWLYILGYLLLGGFMGLAIGVKRALS